MQLTAFTLRDVLAPRYVASAILLLMGGGLLVLAVPRTVAAWETLAAAPAIGRLEIGARPSSESVETGIAALQRALRWVSSGRRLTDLALLELERARSMTAEDPMRATWLARSEKHLIEGLTANPADGYAWLRLAIVRDLRKASPGAVAAALIQSVDVAPNVRPIWLLRAEYMLAYWPAFDGDDLTVMRNQLRTIWRADKAARRPLLDMAARTNQLMILGWALAEDYAAYQEFEAMKSDSVGDRQMR